MDGERLWKEKDGTGLCPHHFRPPSEWEVGGSWQIFKSAH